MPIVEVAVPEPEGIAVGAVVWEDMLVVPVAMVAGSPVAERSFEAVEPTTADCTGANTGAAAAVAGLADVAGATIGFATTCAAGLRGA